MASGVDLAGLLAAHLANPKTSWSVGCFGAVAEFMRDPEEPIATEQTEAGRSVFTDRGGIRIRPVANLRLVASESATRESWSQRVALCLPKDRSAMNHRDVLTELGPDAEAIREMDRNAILFDLGLNALQMDACARVSDWDVVERLRRYCGSWLFEPSNPAMGVMLASNPHRVFVSRVGRIEVFQPIPPASGKSPAGPHTHVLPKLLSNRLTHPADEPIPDGWVPCAHFYPAHPAKDASGVARPYESRCHDAFQDLMQKFGDAKLVGLKNRMMAALSAGEGPSAFAMADDRLARTTMRVGLRQLLAAGGSTPLLTEWREAHDRRQDDLQSEHTSDTEAQHELRH